MDYGKIGAFICKVRKEKYLTQAKLAEKLFVSEKTISKWENGKGLPDTAILPNLCLELDISINELLCGEKMQDIEYKENAERKLLELQQAKEKSDKRLLLAEWFIGGLSTILFLFAYFILLFAHIEAKLISTPVTVVLMVVSFVIFIVSITFCVYIEQKAGYYECAKCGHKHVPTFSQVLFSMHMGRTRYMKCPSCGKKSWQKKVVK